MATISTLAVNLIARTSVFERGMRNSRKSVRNFRHSADKTSRSMKALSATVRVAGRTMRSALSSGLKFIQSGLNSIIRLSKLAAIALLGIGVASVKVSADMQETSNLFDVAMGSMAGSAEKWAKDYSGSLGLFEGTTKKALSTFQLMLTSMGFTEDAAFGMSKGLVQMTNDIASLRNLSLGEAFTKVSAGITGEAEPLKRIGILLNDTVIKNLALKDATIQARIQAAKAGDEFVRYGGKMVRANRAVNNQSSELTDLEKVQLRYKALVKATERDQGDFKKTLDSTSNVFKIIKEQILTTGNTIGDALTPIVTEAAIAMRDWLADNQSLIGKWAGVASSQIEKVIGKIKQYLFILKEEDNPWERIFKDVGSLTGSLASSIEKAFIKLKPVAINMGEQIAFGFIKAVEGTKLGKVLNFIGRIPSESTVGATASFIKAAEGGRRADVETAKIVKAIGTVMSRSGAMPERQAVTFGEKIARGFIRVREFDKRRAEEIR